MTAAQLREILKSNLLTVAAPEAGSTALPEDYIQAGAHILLAPACRFMNDEEADALAELFEAAADRAFVAGRLQQPTEAIADDAAYEAYTAHLAAKTSVKSVKNKRLTPMFSSHSACFITVR